MPDAFILGAALRVPIHPSHSRVHRAPGRLSPMTQPAALPLMLAAPFAGALVLLAYGAWSSATCEQRLHRAALIAAAFAGLAAISLLALAPTVMDGTVYRAGVDWLPVFGADLGLRIDALALLFALLILGIGLLVILYARYYLSPQDRTPWFYALLMAFMGAMLGIALSDNLILLAMSWELTSLISFLLIGFWDHRSDARQGARMALTVTGAGGLALLAGLLLLGWIAGGWDLDTVLKSGDVVRAHPLYPVCLGLVLLGAFTKSAQFPFQFWLPHAMAAPTPVSAYLHSATMVKAGIFLLARLYPVLSGTDAWFFAVTSAGAATLLVGAWHAIFQHDIKGLLAYSTISHLGLIVMLLGLNSDVGAVAALFHMLNHATFKASLFMAAGIVDHETGTRDMRRINGLARSMPVTATLAIVASAAMAGVPLLNGFLSKEMFFSQTLAIEGSRALQVLVPLVAAIAAALSVAYSARFVHDVFFNGDPGDLPKKPHEPPQWMRRPVELLVLLCLLVGLLPGLIVGPLLSAGARDLLGDTPPEYSLALWHGFNLPLGMSFVAMVGGLTLYFWLQRGSYRSLHAHPTDTGLGKRIFERQLQKVVNLAGRFDTALHGAGMRVGLFIAVAVAVIAMVMPWLTDEPPSHGLTGSLRPDLNAGAVMVWCIGAAAAIGTVWFAHQRLIALLVLGVVGLVVSLAFVWFSAPDLALTQLLVEVATMILMMLALRYLPAQTQRDDDDAHRLRDMLFAGLGGLGLGATAWAVMMRPFDSLSGHYLERALDEAGGTNVVNVVIVDFRGFDTFGETMVMAAAGLVIHALIADRRLSAISGPARAGLAMQPEHRLPVLLTTLASHLLPFALMVSAYFFLRGHNLPGGGFIAGLITAIALLVQHVAFGARAFTPAGLDAQQAFTFQSRFWHRVIGAGLLIATLTGLGSWLFDYPFLTSTFGHPHLPLIGEVPLASAAAFDLGVYLAVVGATLLALGALSRLGRRP